MLQKPLVPTTRISGDCNQTWPGVEKAGALDSVSSKVSDKPVV